MTDKQIKELAFENDYSSDFEVNVFIDGYKKAMTEPLTLYGVVRSFLVKESESLGVEVNDLYLHLYDDKLYLEKEDTESFYFDLEDVREVE